ncbi:MAG: sugar ABC transporter ATP-binding protein [Clostridiaceae bacterium]|nr:sugar ABC transporter ATP-binding protein [Clostridiaceae bacterium]
MTKSPLLEMKKVTKIFPGVKALDKVDFSINEGEIHLLLGENGAGKSTLIKTIVGINKPDEGEMFWQGQPLVINSIDDAYSLGIAVIYQELSNVACLSVVENMFLGNEIKKNGFIDWKEQRRQTIEALKVVGLKDINVNQPMSALGVGQKQLVEIAKALARDAKLLIMDEPTSSLSSSEIEALLNLMLELKNHGVAILFITHKLDEGQKVGDRVTVLKDGKNSGRTVPVKGLTEDQIIRMMVGRELTEKYPTRVPNIGDVFLKCKNLTGEKFTNINFELRKGEILGIFGLIGAGRTELARGIFGADPLIDGEVIIDGTPVKIRNVRDAIKNGIVLLSENRKEDGLILIHDVVDNGTVVNIQEFKNKSGFIDNKKCQIAVREVAEQLNLRPMHLNKEVLNFSGGNQQKIVIIKWLLTNGKIFIFDEPTKGVDVGAKVEIYTIMNSILDRGDSIIMISSEIEEILGMSNRVMTMYDGRVTGIIENTSSLDQETVLAMATGGE